jgi:hypothetical protein
LPTALLGINLFLLPCRFATCFGAEELPDERLASEYEIRTRLGDDNLRALFTIGHEFLSIERSTASPEVYTFSASDALVLKPAKSIACPVPPDGDSCMVE